MIISRATHADVAYLISLTRRAWEEIGFIPSTRYHAEIEAVHHHGTILIGAENRDPVGFIYVTYPGNGIMHITQICIQEDARRAYRATALIQASILPNLQLIRLRCAADLEAKAFWASLGFQVRDITHPHTKRHRPIIEFQKTIGGLFLPKEFAGEHDEEAIRRAMG